MATINIVQQSTPQQITLIQEDISDDLGSSNVVYSSSQPFIPGTLQVFFNGLNMRLNADFVEINNQSFRFINYDSSFLRTINSTNSTLAIKYFKYIDAPEPSLFLSSITTLSTEFEDENEEKFIDDISDQVFPGVTSFFASNQFNTLSLDVYSDNVLLSKDLDFSIVGNDAIYIINRSSIKNNNLVLKYILG